MTTRRNFLKGGTAAATGVVFCSCGLLERAYAQGASRNLTVASKARRSRPSTCTPIATSAKPARCSAPTPPPPSFRRSTGRPRPSSRSTSGWPRWMPGHRHGGAVDQPVLVRPRPRPRRPDREDPKREAGRALRLEARALRRLRLAHPAAARSRRAAARDRGQEAGTEGRRHRRRVEGEELSDTKFHPFWAKAEELGVPCSSIRRASPSSHTTRRKWLARNMYRQPAGDDDRALAPHLRRHARPLPGPKILAAHGGGYLPSYAARSDHGGMTFPGGCNPIKLKKKPTEYLQQLYFDSLVFTPEACATSRPRPAPARSCWAPTTPTRGNCSP